MNSAKQKVIILLGKQSAILGVSPSLRKPLIQMNLYFEPSTVSYRTQIIQALNSTSINTNCTIGQLFNIINTNCTTKQTGQFHHKESFYIFMYVACVHHVAKCVTVKNSDSPYKFNINVCSNMNSTWQEITLQHVLSPLSYVGPMKCSRGFCLHQCIHNGMKSNELCSVFVLKHTQKLTCQ